MPTPTVTQAYRKMAITVPKSLGEDKLILQGFTLTEEISRPFCCELKLYSQDTEVDYNKIVGETVTIRLERADGKMRYIHGYVSRFAQGGQDDADGGHSYQATVVPWLWLLTRSSDCRIFQEKSVPDIVKEVFADFGCSELVELNLTATYPKHEYVVQYRETSFNFVSRLLEHEGIYYYFKHENGKHKLVLADSPSKHVAVEGYEKIPYHEGGNLEGQGVSEWLLETRMMPGEHELIDFDFTVPGKDLKSSKILKGQHPIADSPLFDYPGGYTDKGAGDTRAATRIEELMMHHSVATAAGDARGLTVGCKFKLYGAPRTDHDGEYVITSMTCEAHEDGFGRASGNALIFSNRFTCVKATTQIRPRRITPKPVITGPQTAIVTTSSDSEEIMVDKYGRVKVHFHWDRHNPKNDTSSCWIRVAQLWAGKGWGAMFIPRKDQEVIVEFLEGDPDRPIITGRVYNGANMPPYGLPANKTISTIQSRSSTGGGASNFNEIKMEDKKGDELLYIQAEKDRTMLVKNDNTETINHDETLTVKHDRKKTVDNDETTKVGHDRTENVGNNESITIGVNRTEQVGANEDIAIGANRTETVGASETVTVSMNRTHTIGINDALTIGAAQEITVGAAQAITVGASQDVNVGNSMSLKVGKAMEVEVAKTLTVKVGDSITITTGDSSITMKKNGDITIKGKNITIQGSGKINAKADGNIVMKGQKILQN